MSGLLSEVDLTDQNRIVFPEGEYTLPMSAALRNEPSWLNTVIADFSSAIWYLTVLSQLKVFVH